MTIISAAGAAAVIIVVDYAPDGLAWARLTDFHALGWLIDDNMAVPYKPAPPAQHYPIIFGAMPAPPPDTSPVLSPSWAVFDGLVQLQAAQVFVPTWGKRGGLYGLFTALSTNNGAHRPLISRLAINPTVIGSFNIWAHDFPDLVLADEGATSKPGFGTD